MKLVAVVAAAAVSSAYAACTIKKDTTTCVEDNCKYIGGHGVIAAKKDSFGCGFGPTQECKDGATVAIAGASTKAGKCLLAPKKETAAAAACDKVADTDGKCTTIQLVKASAEIPKKDPTCVPKTCLDYPKEADCIKQSGCEFKKEVKGTDNTYKCKSGAGNTADKKKLCEAVKVADKTKVGECGKAANGGTLCCTVDVTPGKATSPAMCVEKATASAGTAVLSAFAAVSAALLM
jgi:hypothetical protein